MNSGIQSVPSKTTSPRSKRRASLPLRGAARITSTVCTSTPSRSTSARRCLRLLNTWSRLRRRTYPPMGIDWDDRRTRLRLLRILNRRTRLHLFLEQANPGSKTGEPRFLVRRQRRRHSKKRRHHTLVHLVHVLLTKSNFLF